MNASAGNALDFSRCVVDWFIVHGRKDLPWQAQPTPYRVWISEVMLQQTQVATVIPYYLRFVERFADIHALAAASLDEVLALWSGLGYYARARNMHETACIVCANYTGQLPATIDALRKLPGIGRSTAAAILALCWGQRYAILDGNVKRVLTRYHAVSGWPGEARVERELWTLAEHYMPVNDIAAYTQAMMDLGATVCTRSKPACARCPLQKSCAAYVSKNVEAYPTQRPRRELPVQNARFLILHNRRGEVLLEKRAPTGIWGGLWSLPSLPTAADPVDWCHKYLRATAGTFHTWPTLRHTFSHFHLDITPLYAHVETCVEVLHDGDGLVWHSREAWRKLGIPAPVMRLLMNSD